MYAACASGNGGLMEVALLAHSESSIHAALKLLEIETIVVHAVRHPPHSLCLCILLRPSIAINQSINQS